MILRFACLALLAYSTSACSNLDPRSTCSVLLSFESDTTTATLSYVGPTPYLTEPFAVIACTDDATTISLGQATETATTFYDRATASLFGFLGSIFGRLAFG